MKCFKTLVTLLFFFNVSFAQSFTDDFVLSNPGQHTSVFVGESEQSVVKIAAHALSEDIQDITGKLPLITSDKEQMKGNRVVIGTVDNPVIAAYMNKNNLPSIKGKWEHFFIRVVNDPADPSQKVLLIVGSDPRGAAYGVFTLSRMIGVSPWKWWADVKPQKRQRITLNTDIDVVQGSSVKYRGIFLNDEDWGLRPWASKTVEPEAGNIGPKTYAKIFELLLRLKANTVWPAMHPTGRGTTAFLEMKGNEAMAKKYDIVVGTAHNEPMMTNIPVVWKTKEMGPFNYLTNKNRILQLWDKKVKQGKDGENIYTLGMRGLGDSRMQGVSGMQETVQLMEEIVHDQRNLLERNLDKKASAIPQAFVPYKEVLDIYNHGMKVPDDVTLVWPDDNYGYLRRLSNAKERKRTGSSGVYYHISYWGTPHDYLWLSSTQPGLIWEELKKAWRYDARRMWIINVGDIKPAEYNIQFIMDLAWDINSIRSNEITHYMEQWHNDIFGKENGAFIAKVMEEYYRLAAIKKPEFMGWSRVEPITKTKSTAFKPFENGDEIKKRIEAYRKLISQVNQVEQNIPKHLENAFFELVTYPVKASAYMNEKFLYAQKSQLFARYNLPVVNSYADRSRKAYDSIKILTEKYNHLANGKWKYMMDMAPRRLPVFDLPKLPDTVSSDHEGGMVWLEGDSLPCSRTSGTLPRFNPYTSKKHFIQIFNKGTNNIPWKIQSKPKWIRIYKTSGILQEEVRINVSIDWDKKPKKTKKGELKLKVGGEIYTIIVPTDPAIRLRNKKGRFLMEQDGRVYIQASDFIKKQDVSKKYQWGLINQLGYNDSAYTLLPIPVEPLKNMDQAFLEYKFYTYSKDSAQITIFTLPTHPVNDSEDVRVAVSVDNGKKQVKSFQTFGLSEQWRKDVLSNHAKTVFEHKFEKPGWHTIKVYPMDPGVVLDQIEVNFKPVYFNSKVYHFR